MLFRSSKNSEKYVKVNNKKISFVVFIANFEQTSYIVHASITYFVHELTCWAYKVKLPMFQSSHNIHITKNSCYFILNCKEKVLNDVSKILEKYL